MKLTIVVDDSNERDPNTVATYLTNQGVPVLIDHRHAIAHNKVILIDGRTLITGSYNFTNQAETENAENVLIVKGQPELLKVYRQSFLEHKAHSKTAQVRAETPARRAA